MHAIVILGTLLCVLIVSVWMYWEENHSAATKAVKDDTHLYYMIRCAQDRGVMPKW